MTVTPPSRDKLLQVAQQLPAWPPILAQLNKLLLDINSGLDEIAILLKRDASLTARIIRLSNSIMYGGGGAVGSIEDAVSRVGFAEIYRLTGLAAVASLSELNLPFYGFTGPQLRDNTLMVALTMEAMARFSGEDAKIAYTAGLMRSTGKLALDRLARQTRADAATYTRSGLGNLSTWEHSFFGCSNVDAAVLILKAWQFPASIVESVRQQYFFAEPTGEYVRLATLLNLACGIVCDAGFSLPGEAACWEVTAEKLRTVGLSELHVQECSEEAVAAFESIKASLG
jgi:HD-like signal output (HDOD) protein